MGRIKNRASQFAMGKIVLADVYGDGTPPVNIRLVVRRGIRCPEWRATLVDAPHSEIVIHEKHLTRINPINPP